MPRRHQSSPAALLGGCVFLGCFASSLPAPAQVLPPNGPGQALSFDGVNDRLTGTPSTLPAGNSPYTIEAWINPTVMNSGAIAAWGTFGTLNRVNAFRLSPTGLVNYWWANDLSVTVNLVGDWHHVAATFDGTTRRILVDGVVRGNDTPTGHNATTGNFSIGSANNGEFFAGGIDEVRIWNVGRTAAQIQEAMRRQLFGNEGGLVAYWRLDEGTGIRAFDATGNGANAVTLANGPGWLESSILPWAPEVGGGFDSILSATSVELAGFGRAKNSATKIFFQWGATISYGNVTPPVDFGSDDDPGFFFQPITGLTPGATYHARAVGTNAHGYSYSPDFTFMAPTNVVLNTNDSGFGSLREVIRGLTPGDTVRFASNITGVIALTSGEIAITNSMNIVGPGASVLAVSGGGMSRLFRIEPGKKVLLSGLTLKDGITVGSSGASAPNLPPGAMGGQGGDASGGAILNYSDLTVANCVLSGHDAVGGNGGAGQNAGGLAATAGGWGGGAYGGAIYGHNSARLTVVNCSFVTCDARGGQAGSGGFGTGGTAGASGGRGGEARGGAIYAAQGCPLWITNCTFASNDVDGGQGGQGGGGGTTGQGGQGGHAGGFALENSGPFALVGCTVAGNTGTPGLGGGGSVMGPSGQTGSAVYSLNPSLTNAVRNSIIAANQGGAPSSDVVGAFVSGGFNLIGVTNGVNNFTRSTDQAGTAGVPLAPRLLALDRYGGVYPVMPLATNSPALDRGISTGIPTDQRGLMRRVDDPTAANATGGDASDIGAVEMSAPRIVSIQWVKPEEVVKITFTTEPGRRYRLESADRLVSGLWQPASDVLAGTGGWVSVVDPDPQPPARFYRVAIVP